MNINLTPELKAALELRHSKVRDKRECDRLKAILLRSEGWKINMIAQALRLHECTITRHIRDFLNEQKLQPKNGGSESLLSDEQKKQLIEHLTEVTYYHTHQICSYIKQTFNITFSVSGLNKWLHRNVFSYKQPKGVPHKFDVDKQDKFIDEYNKLKSDLAEGEVILFMDATHPTQATKITSGWIRTGVDKTIETTGSRTRLNIIGAIELDNLSKAVIEQYETINGDSIIDFFEQLRARYIDNEKLHLILDGAGYHKKKEVIEKAKVLNIELHYLPAYSPNLNPIERLWKVMNERVRNNKYFATAKEFRQGINHFFEEVMPKVGDSLNTSINDNFQQFYPAS